MKFLKRWHLILVGLGCLLSLSAQANMSEATKRKLAATLEATSFQEASHKKAREHAKKQAQIFETLCKTNSVNPHLQLSVLVSKNLNCLTTDNASLELCLQNFWDTAHHLRLAMKLSSKSRLHDSIGHIQILRNQIEEKKILKQLTPKTPSNLIWLLRHGESKVAKVGGQNRNAPLDAKSRNLNFVLDFFLDNL